MRIKLTFAAIAAMAALGIAAHVASASRFSLQEKEKGFKIVWSDLKLEAGGAAVDCPVTLEGTYEVSSLVKRAGTRIGVVTGAAVRGGTGAGECTGGTMTLLTATLPWPISFDSFTGTLPTIIGIAILIILWSWSVHLNSVNLTCLAATRTEQPAKGIATVDAAGHITALRADETAGIENSGGFFCELSKAHFANSGTATGREGGVGPVLRLI